MYAPSPLLSLSSISHCYYYKKCVEIVLRAADRRTESVVSPLPTFILLFLIFLAGISLQQPLGDAAEAVVSQVHIKNDQEKGRRGCCK